MPTDLTSDYEFTYLTWKPGNAFSGTWSSHDRAFVEIVTYTGTLRETAKMTVEEADSFGYIPTKIMAMIAVANI